MAQIIPISDFKNLDISKIVHETNEPIFLTKNGHSDMVVMSMEMYERNQLQNEIYLKLSESEIEAKATSERHSHKEVFDDLRKTLGL